MRYASRIVFLLAVGLLPACLSLPRVHMIATPGDMEMLNGQWKGEYDSPALGRRGRIEFKLRAESGDATGSVVMIPQHSAQPYGRDGWGSQRPDAADPFDSQLLSIRFVRASAGEISGVLDPYWDPDRNCEARTVFRGFLAKGVIEGTFTTRWDCGEGEASGRWRVTHKGDDHVE